MNAHRVAQASYHQYKESHRSNVSNGLVHGLHGSISYTKCKSSIHLPTACEAAQPAGQSSLEFNARYSLFPHMLLHRKIISVSIEKVLCCDWVVSIQRAYL